MLESHKKKSISRLNRIKGQIEGVIKMIEDDKYCPEILTQVLAIQGGLRSTAVSIVDSHLHTCAGKKLTSNDPEVREAFIKELVKAFELSTR